MRLAFYSGGSDLDNYSLNKEVVKLVEKKDPLFCFIPSESYDHEIEFHNFVQQFRPFGITRFFTQPLDESNYDFSLEEIFKSDLIHLGGGNTFYFLNTLRKKKLIGKLKEFVKNGGVLTGLSAGGILMTQTIDTAAYPDFDCDDNEVGLKNLKGLGLVNFDFFPHFIPSKRYDQALKKLASKSKRPLYGVPDGSGIIINNGEIKFVGKSYVYLGNNSSKHF